MVVNHTLNSRLCELDALCRAHHTPLVVVEVWGLCGVVVCDFGSAFKYLNGSGKEYVDVLVERMQEDSQDKDSMV